MPLKMGYTPEILGNNITEFVKLGYLHKNAINIALAVARDSYRVEHPTGKFPKHLQGAGKFYRENPVSEKIAHKLRKASPRTFEKMTDEEIKKAVKVSVKPAKRVKKNPVISENFVVRGITNDGKEVFYTGKAGQGFTSKSVLDAFTYDTKEGAGRKATVLNKMTNIHGIHFISMQVKRVRKNPVQPLKNKEYHVQVSQDKKDWTLVARFKTKESALEYAKALSKKQPFYYVRVRT